MIYTKIGDDGTTSLVEGSRVLKCDARVETYGTVDELNSHIGLLAEMMLAIPNNQTFLPNVERLKTIQNNLFVAQTLLATGDVSVAASLPQLQEKEVCALESIIDELSAEIPPLSSFVIPGGSMAGAQAHVARCVCRRAERLVVALSQTVSVPPEILHYLNRLSDLLFVLSRWIVLRENKNEIFWHST